MQVSKFSIVSDLFHSVVVPSSRLLDIDCLKNAQSPVKFSRTLKSEDKDLGIKD